jgi:hypothetical protein
MPEFVSFSSPKSDERPHKMHAVDNAALDRIAVENDAKQGERMLAELNKFLARFISYPSEHARIAHALWIIHAHLMDRWDSTPRIAFVSPEPGSGKTRALEITEPLVPRPMEAVNMSPSALFRSVGSEDGLPTILFDEIDTVFGPKAKENEEVRGLLNAGHRRGAKTYRSVIRGKAIEVEAIEAFCAVAPAGLGWLPDTILSRSIIIRMRRRHTGETVEPYRRRIHSPEGDRIRGLIEIWAAGVTFEGWPELPQEIQDRNADVWEPLIQIADLIGGEWPARARVAAVTLVTDLREAEPSLGIRLLTDLKLIFKDALSMTTKSILANLTTLEEAPWRDLRGKPLDERSLANRLRAYGIKSTTIRAGETVAKGYKRSDFFDAWARYVPASVSDNSVTSVTSDTVPDLSRSAVTDVTEPEPDGWTFNLENENSKRA